LALKEKLKRTLKFIAFLLLITGVGVAFFMWHEPLPSSSAFLGYVEGEYVRVAPSMGGVLLDLPIHRGMNVSAGSPLFVLEQENEIAARDEAQRRYERTKFNLKNLMVGKRPEEIDVIKEMLAQAEADQQFNILSLERQEKLVTTNSASLESLDRARTAYNRGKARIAELKSQLEVAQLPAREMEIKAAEMEAMAAKDALRQAQWRLDQKSVKSEVGGMVCDTLYVVGEWVQAGSPVAVLLPPENIKVRFFVPQPWLNSLKLGQRVIIKREGHIRDVSALITYISPAAEYTPPMIYSREWRTKLMYMVEARPAEYSDTLHPGQPVDISVG